VAKAETIQSFSRHDREQKALFSVPVKVKSKPFMRYLLLSQRDTAPKNRLRSFQKPMKPMKMSDFSTPVKNPQGWFIFESQVQLDISLLLIRKITNRLFLLSKKINFPQNIGHLMDLKY